MAKIACTWMGSLWPRRENHDGAMLIYLFIFIYTVIQFFRMILQYYRCIFYKSIGGTGEDG